MHRILTVFLLLTLLPAAGRTQGIPVDGFAAMVNDRVITVSDVLNFVQPIERELRTRYTGEALRSRVLEAYNSSLNALIERALIIEEFTRLEGNIPDPFVDDRIQEIILDRFQGDRTAFLQALNEDGSTLDEWRDEVRNQLIISILRRQEVLMHIAVPPRTVRETYEARRDQYRTPEEVKVRMIVLNKGETETETTVKRQEAESVLEKLRGGADFAETAMAVSEGSRASRGGDWGWIEPAILRPELAGALENLQPGEISEVIESEDAFYLVTLDGRKQASYKSFADVQADIEMELRRAEEERLHRAWIDRLRQRHVVRTFRAPMVEQDI